MHFHSYTSNRRLDPPPLENFRDPHLLSDTPIKWFRCMVLVWPTSEFWRHAGTLIGATYLFLCYFFTSERGWGDKRLTAWRQRKKGRYLNTETHFILVYHHFRELQILIIPTCRCQTKLHHMNIQTFIAEISWKSNKGVIRSLKRGKVHKIYQYIVISMYLTRLFNLFCYTDLKSGDSLISFSIIHRIYMKFWI